MASVVAHDLLFRGGGARQGGALLA